MDQNLFFQDLSGSGDFGVQKGFLQRLRIKQVIIINLRELPMNKIKRSCVKNSLELSPSQNSAKKKFKRHQYSSRKTIPKKAKELSLHGTSKNQKKKSATISQRNQKIRLSENKMKKEKKAVQRFSSPKMPKQQKNIGHNEQNKNKLREIQRPKLIEQYLKSKITSSQKRNQIGIQSTQFFMPFTHTKQKQNSVHNVSQFMSSDESHIYQDVPSQLSASISNQKVAQSSNLKQSRIISVQKWEYYETLKLKNEQLTNYIEELQRIQKKMIEQKKQQQILLREKKQKGRDQLIQQFAELNEKHQEITNNNATLQQMFNQGQSIVQALKLENAHLSQRVNQSLKQAQKLSNHNQKLKNDTNQLKRQSLTLKEELKSLKMEKEQMARRYDNVCLQKEKIKAQAQQMLVIIKRIQTQLEPQ